MFAPFDGLVGREGSKCFEPGFRHGAGHECYEAVADATGSMPTFATDYVPRGSVRRPNPLGWLIGTPPDDSDTRRMKKKEAAPVAALTPGPGPLPSMKHRERKQAQAAQAARSSRARREVK